LRYVAPQPNVLTFGPEKVDAYEIGAKLENSQHTLQLNAAAFTSIYKNVQLTYFQTLGAPVTENGGNARINGFELEFKAKPTARLNIGASVAYLDAYYTYLLPGLNAGATTPLQYITLENRLPNTPRWAPNLDIDYSIDAPFGRFLLAANGRYSTTVYNDAQNSPYLRQASYTLANTSMTFTRGNAPWSARLYIDNVTDKQYIVSGDSNFGIGFHEAEFNRPRTYGAGMTYSF
jgi:iron complex outermembrane receptor protein